MMKKFICLIFILFSVQLSIAQAFNFDEIFNVLENIYGVNSQSRDDLDHIQTLMDTFQTTNHHDITDMSTRLFSQLTGDYQLGDILNSAQDEQWKEWSPDTWLNAMQSSAGLNNQYYTQLMQHYDQTNPIVAESVFTKTSTPETSHYYQEASQTNRATYVNASYLYRNINPELQRLHQLSSYIDHTENVKAAIDLNNRIAIELASIMEQNVKANSLIAEENVMTNQNDLNGLSDAAVFNH
ncbi:MAG: hypothetical protein KIT27_05520 [Legionellales bacterium]|nr:hypothetical protein [Legionellales bacterium]